MTKKPKNFIAAPHQRLSRTHCAPVPTLNPSVAVAKSWNVAMSAEFAKTTKATKYTDNVASVCMSASDYGVIEHFEDADREDGGADCQAERDETHTEVKLIRREHQRILAS
jgi:hypothetical protein